MGPGEMEEGWLMRVEIGIKNNSFHMNCIPAKKPNPSAMLLFAIIFSTAFLASALFWLYAKLCPADPINTSFGLMLGWSGWAAAIFMLVRKINKKERIEFYEDPKT